MDIKDYADTQVNLISSLQKEISELKEKNKHLELLLNGTIPNLEMIPIHLGISNEQIICEDQIRKLKDKAIEGTLNADDTRKFATFVEVLEKIKKTIKDPKMKAAEEMSSEDLIRLVVNNDAGQIKQ